MGSLGRLTTDLKQVNSKFASCPHLAPMTTPALHRLRRRATEARQAIVPVAKVPEVLAKLAEMKGEAFAALDDFMPDYREYYGHAIVVWAATCLTWICLILTCSPVSTTISIDLPEPLPVFNVDSLALPAGLAADIAQRHHDRLTKQLDGAKQAAIEGAQKHMDVVEKQLTDGKRLHQSLLDNAKRHATLLRDMVEGYDNDPRVLEVADLIDQRIASIPNIEQVKYNSTKRDQAIRAAGTASKALAAVAKSPSTAQPVAPAAIQHRHGRLTAR